LILIVGLQLRQPTSSRKRTPILGRKKRIPEVLEEQHAKRIFVPERPQETCSRRARSGMGTISPDIACTGKVKRKPVMVSSQLKRTERAIAMMRRESGLPREAADALQELVDVIRALEGRLAMLEAKRRPSPTAEMDLPNRS
jgi:hypothetical protein